MSREHLEVLHSAKVQAGRRFTFKENQLCTEIIQAYAVSALDGQRKYMQMSDAKNPLSHLDTPELSRLRSALHHVFLQCEKKYNSKQFNSGIHMPQKQIENEPNDQELSSESENDPGIGDSDA